MCTGRRMRPMAGEGPVTVEEQVRATYAAVDHELRALFLDPIINRAWRVIYGDAFVGYDPYNTPRDFRKAIDARRPQAR